MDSDKADARDGGLSLYVLKVAIAVGITLLIVAVLALLSLTIDVVMLAFAGILIAVLLRGLGNWLSRHAHLGQGWSILIVIIALLSLLVAILWLSASRVVEQFDTLARTLPIAIQRSQQHLREYRFGDWLVRQAASIDWSSRGMNLVQKMTGALSTAFGAVVDFVIVAFLGLYLTVQPRVYLNGIIRLFPVTSRPRMKEVLHEIGHTLQWWFLGIFSTMTVIGLLSGVGLWLLDIPLALALGVLAGLLSFVPYLGALVSSIPAILIAMINGPEHALYVAALYLGIHIVEGYLLNPVIQHYAISIPPALLLFAQIMLGILLGAMGVILAAPIAATVLVVVKMLYIEDLLEDRGEKQPHGG